MTLERRINPSVWPQHEKQKMLCENTHARTLWANVGASLLMKKWLGAGHGQRSSANNAPLLPLRLGCHTVL